MIAESLDKPPFAMRTLFFPYWHTDEKSGYIDVQVVYLSGRGETTTQKEAFAVAFSQSGQPKRQKI